MTQRIIASLLLQAAENWPNRVYLDGERSYTYTEAIIFVYKLAKKLESLGIKRWDRVLIFAQNRVEILLTLFAANIVGAIVTIVHEASTDNTLKKICSDLEPKVVFLDNTTMPQSASLTSDYKFDIADIVDSDNDTIDNVLKYLDNIALRSGTIDSDPALIIYTSGSTGSPRGVVLTQDNILFVVEKIQARLSYSLNDSISLFLPLSFDYGLYQAFLAAQVGACLVVSKSDFAGPMLVSTLRQRSISVLPGVPNLFESLLRLLERRKEILPDIRIVTNTGAHLTQQQILRLQNTLPNALIYSMYGLTECKRVSILTPEEAEKHQGSVGRALDNTDALIVSDSGCILPPGEIGELVVCGRHVALGYWKAPVETETRFRTHPLGIGRSLYTGDDFQMDQEGYLYFVGRRDEQIKRRGFRMHPLEIETASVAIDGVKSAAVVQLGDHLALFVVTDEANITENTILSKLSNLLESYKIPDSVEILEKLPNTSNGKVDRRALEHRASNKLICL
ncbi:class I adenylate-forming enzyme family protein [aff. Roholtiella sp. LEGE 12411]|uniref:class I adenylate-forming enzyme family protein n=1 Tax=aff. Roholtiella sp. LEGE 12411 TaxID=1828822 RepID=UPI0018825D1B|nr:class I adenylate-forming enzyme family protein [aff. Roholtiella sp. LEGE 12411]MBE9033596.1 acyl--CoA ligase [aff. Roholtiella sp. LEGE 12411]